MTKPAKSAIGSRPFRLAALAVLGAVLVGACANPPSPSPSASQRPSASPSGAPSTASGSETACASTELTAMGGPWGGAAGSRGSDVVIQNTGAAACLLLAGPTVAMVDPAGIVVLSNTPPQVGVARSIEPGGKLGFSLVLGNWCDQQVRVPLHFSLALPNDAVNITSLAVNTLDDLPPCNGPGQPASLSTTDWEPAA